MAANSGGSGHTSSDYGWVAGGDLGNGDYDATDMIQRYSYASSGNSSDWSNLIAYRYNYGGTSATDYGYAAGGAYADIIVNTIQRFAYASASNATDVGDLTSTRQNHWGVSGTNYGYICGGATNIIERHAFASSANASDWGDLTQSLYTGIGVQY